MRVAWFALKGEYFPLTLGRGPRNGPIVILPSTTSMHAHGALAGTGSVDCSRLLGKSAALSASTTRL